MEKMAELMELAKKADEVMDVCIDVISGFGYGDMRLDIRLYERGYKPKPIRRTEHPLTTSGVANSIDWLKEQYEVSHANQK